MTDLEDAVARHQAEDAAEDAENAAALLALRDQLAQARADDDADDKTIADLKAEVARLAPEEVLFTHPGRTVTMKAGTVGGGAGYNGAHLLKRPALDTRTTYEVMFAKGFDWKAGGKIPGPAWTSPGTLATMATGGKPDPLFTAGSLRLMWLTAISGSWPDPANPKGPRLRALTPELVGYPYFPDDGKVFGDNLFTRFQPTGGLWIPVDIRVKHNTVGKADGIVQIRLGGAAKPQVDLSNVITRKRDDVLHRWHLEQVFPGGAGDLYESDFDRVVHLRNTRVTTPAAA